MSWRPPCLSALPIVAAVALLAGGRASAGNIDPADAGLKYAYAENIGWINFKPSQGPGVTVTASALTGFAWSENVGWINLSPAMGGVRNDGLGRLSGFAWGENTGWINFAPVGAGVVIGSTGQFAGRAWGENVGWITFNATGALPFGVSTSWRRCIGDCDGDLAVHINELVLGVGIALGERPLSACPAFDVDDSGSVQVNELIAAVRAALEGCTPDPPGVEKPPAEVDPGKR